MIISTFLVFRSPAYAEGSLQTNLITISVQSSQHSLFTSRITIHDSEIMKALIKAKVENTTTPKIMSDICITIEKDNQEKTFRLEKSGYLWDESTSKQLIMPSKISEKLLNYAEIVRKTHYGKLVSWKDADRIVPLKSIFTITDLETGLTFKVQRRAGKDHADVQPLTKKDSSIMKQIYHDNWSWRRTAVLVHSGNEWLAASMNGMPHGGDGIPDNGFSGHFCVHFLHSSTHKSPDPDLAHQLMVYKAAGELKAFFEAASPLTLANSFVEAMNQQDLELFKQASEGISKEKAKFFMEEMKSLLSIQPEKQQKVKNEKNSNKINPSDTNSDESLSAEVQLKLLIYKKGASKQINSYTFTFNRISKQSPWQISDVVIGTKLNVPRLIK